MNSKLKLYCGYLHKESRAHISHVYMIYNRLDVCRNNVSPSFIPCLYSFQCINPHGSRKPAFFLGCLHQEWSSPPSLPFCFSRHLVTMAIKLAITVPSFKGIRILPIPSSSISKSRGLTNESDLI